MMIHVINCLKVDGDHRCYVCKNYDYYAILHFFMCSEVFLMKLDEYLFRNKLSRTDFAEQLGISRGHLQHILNGSRRPSVPLAKKIQEITEGKVTKEEALFPEDFETEDLK